MLEVARPLFAYSNNVVANERAERQSDGGVEIACGRGKAGQKSHQVAEQNEKEKGREERNVFSPLLADDLIALADHQLNQQLSDVLRAELCRRNHRIAGFGQSATSFKCEQDQ